MRRRAALAAALVLTLALVGAPSAGACPFDAASPHACCAAGASRTAAEATSCCWTEDAGAAAHSASSDDGADCDCLHAPADSPMVEVAPPVHSSEHAAVLAPDPVAAAAEPAPVRAGHRGDCLPRSSPQPLFVIDCAFLI